LPEFHQKPPRIQPEINNYPPEIAKSPRIPPNQKSARNSPKSQPEFHQIIQKYTRNPSKNYQSPPKFIFFGSLLIFAAW